MDIKIPAVGESVKEARILRWLKQDGEFVKADEPVLEIETDKASDSVPAPGAGIVHIKIPADQVVAVGAVVGTIEPGQAPPPASRPSPASAPAPVSASAPVSAATAPRVLAAESIPSPAAQRVMAERNVEAAAIVGTGRDGRIIKEDVLSAPSKTNGEPTAPAAAARLAPEAQARETRKPMSAIRQRIAERLVLSQQSTATLTTFNEADMTAVSELRTKHKDKFKEKHGVGLGFMSFFVKAAIEALKAFPSVNARIDGSDFVYQNFYDIGVAVSTERGLLVPIVRDADRLSFAGIEKKIVELAGLARDNKISTTHLQGGTFTITNGGIFGSLLSTPILNPPQCAILGMHSIQKRPVAIDDEVVIRPMMYLALSYDHRLIDGREAVQFLVRIKECVENPERMLLEI
jgi:2-oxoglutarate dehydrogenase E2 component (dihydrolipoamide succinyltransferase)